MTRPPVPCPACGAPVAAAFCTSCGARATAPGTPPPSEPHEQTVIRPRLQKPAPPPSAGPGLPPGPLPPQATRPLFHDEVGHGQRPSVPRTTPIPPPGTDTGTGVLGFAVEQTGDVETVRPARNGKRALIASVIAFVVLVALGVGGTFGYFWWRDRPLTQALTAAGEATDSVLDALASSDDLADVSAAGTKAQKALAEVEKAGKDISDAEGSYADEAREVVADQAELLRAIAPLSELGEESLSIWGSALPVLLEAQDALTSSRGALSEVDAGAAEKVPDSRRPTAHAIDVVGTSATGALTTQLEGLLESLGQVKNTASAAAVGERAAVVGQATDAAATGQDGVTASTLADLDGAFTSLARLEDMSPENLAVWDLVSTDLTTSAQAVGVDPAPATAAMDAWVPAATKRVDEWRLAYAEAEAQRSAATADLDLYAEEMRAILREYQQARDTLQEQVGDDSASSYDTEWAMESGYSTRIDLHDRLTSQWAPAGMEDSHRRLDVLLGDAVSAMAEGYDAIVSWNGCWYECAPDYTDLPGWQTFSSESKRIAEEFADARKAWNTSLTQALGAANATPLPPMPEV